MKICKSHHRIRDPSFTVRRTARRHAGISIYLVHIKRITKKGINRIESGCFASNKTFGHKLHKRYITMNYVKDYVYY